jgi:hypothetical protein
MMKTFILVSLATLLACTSASAVTVTGPTDVAGFAALDIDEAFVGQINGKSSGWELGLFTPPSNGSTVDEEDFASVGIREFSFMYDAGVATIEVFSGQSLLASVSYDYGIAGLNALGLRVAAYNKNQVVREISLTNLMFNGVALPDLGAANTSAYLGLTGLDSSSKWTLSGTYNMDTSDTSANDGARFAVNFKAGTTERVPDSGATAGLLGIAALAFLALRKRLN